MRLGVTLTTIRSMSASEFGLWLAYNALSPIGDERADILAGQITAAVLNAAGAKVQMNEVTLKWFDREEDGNVDNYSDDRAFFKNIMNIQRGKK